VHEHQENPASSGSRYNAVWVAAPDYHIITSSSVFVMVINCVQVIWDLTEAPA